jgi:hypothetical protein
MDGLVSELLRLEDAKHQALVQIDESSYEDSVREQMRLLASRPIGEVRLAQILALSQLIQLNQRLLQNLISTSCAFVFNTATYSASGVAQTKTPARLSVEA